MSTIESARFPKYGCRQCGSVTIRGSYDEFPVFEAKGDAIVFLHTDRDLLGSVDISATLQWVYVKCHHISKTMAEDSPIPAGMS